MSEQVHSGTIENKVNKFLFRYRITPHTVTCVNPAEMLMLRRLRSRLTLLKPNIRNRQLAKQEDATKYSHRKKMREFNIGEQVLTRNYSTVSKWFTGVIIKRTGPVSYEIEVEGGIVRRHVDQIQRKCLIGDKMRKPEEVQTEATKSFEYPIIVESTLSGSNASMEIMSGDTSSADSQINSGIENNPVEADESISNEGATELRRSNRTRKEPHRYQA